MKGKELTGKRFGRLTVKKLGMGTRTPGGVAVRNWECICDCGTPTTVRAPSLLTGNTTSCGCVAKEAVRKRRTKSKWSRLRPTTQSGKRVASPEYRSWQNMLDRCRNPKNPNWPYYGERGIAVCKEWESFDRFMDDMSLKPTPEMTIDRKDASLGYYKDNCRWASRQEQSRNRDYTVTFRGYKTWELAEQMAIPTTTVNNRLSRFHKAKVTANSVFLPSGKKRNPRRFI